MTISARGGGPGDPFCRLGFADWYSAFRPARLLARRRPPVSADSAQVVESCCLWNGARRAFSFPSTPTPTPTHMSTFLKSILEIADAIPGYSADQLRRELTAQGDSRTVTLQEAAKSLHIGISTAHRWIASGKLHATHVGRRILVKLSDLEKIINGK